MDTAEKVIDPKTGFLVYAETGHVVGLMAKPHKFGPGTDFPKWVKAHDSHVVRQKLADGSDHISTPDYAEHHVNRVGGEVTVLIFNEDEEAAALAQKTEKKAEDKDHDHPDHDEHAENVELIEPVKPIAGFSPPKSAVPTPAAKPAAPAETLGTYDVYETDK